MTAFDLLQLRKEKHMIAPQELLNYLKAQGNRTSVG